jgi:hypothetical protein
MILKNPTNIENFEHMVHICDKIIPVTKFEIWIYTSKLGLWKDFLGEFFMVYDIDIHQLNLEKF